jgi:hypothetical protein
MRAKREPLPIEPALAAALRDTARSAEADFLERERMEQVSEAWKTLSPQQRQCLHLRAEGLKLCARSFCTVLPVKTVVFPSGTPQPTNSRTTMDPAVRTHGQC